jgi:tol-pal system protein YbgF
MLARAGRWAFLTGAVVSLTAASSTGAAAEPFGGIPWFMPGEPNAEVEVSQGYGRPAGEIGGDPAYGAPRMDEAALVLRIDRLEGQIRQLTGQIEQMQHMTRKLEEQLRKFQEDVEFRFQEGGGPSGGPGGGPGGGQGAPPAGKALQRRSALEDPAALGIDEPIPGAENVSGKKPLRRSDAFDPASDPTAPGAPRALGSLAATADGGYAGRSSRGSGPALDASDPDAPLALPGARLRGDPEPSSQATTGEPLDAMASGAMPAAATRRSEAPRTDAPAAPARSPAADVGRQDFDLAIALLKQKEYEGAERSFTAFLQKNPNSKLASDAVFYLGETYYLRGRQREAAEQYLKVSTAFAGSPRAPHAFLRLGQSLNALGAKEQACAAYAEIERKFPNASASVKTGAEREAKRARC